MTDHQMMVNALSKLAAKTEEPLVFDEEREIAERDATDEELVAYFESLADNKLHPQEVALLCASALANRKIPKKVTIK